jgi:hypothetical protein
MIASEAVRIRGLWPSHADPKGVFMPIQGLQGLPQPLPSLGTTLPMIPSTAEESGESGAEKAREATSAAPGGLHGWQGTSIDTHA